MDFLALPGSVCRRWFVGIRIGLLEVKSLVEHAGKVRSIESVRYTFGFVMYYV